MKHIYYEIKKIINIKFLAIYLLILLIGIFSFYMSLNKCMDELHIQNIMHLIEMYGDEKTKDMDEQLLSDYEKSRDILGQEESNLQKLLNGEMTASEYSEYARLVAKIKSFEKAWEYVLDKHYLVFENNGYIIVTEYLNCYFNDSMFHIGNILLFLLITAMLVVADKRRGIESILSVTYVGEKNIQIKKGIAASILTGTSVMLFQIIMLGAMYFMGKLVYLNAPVNSLGLYQKSIDMPIGEYLVIYIIVLALLYATTSGIIVTLFSRFSETEYNVTKWRKSIDGNS